MITGNPGRGRPRGSVKPAELRRQRKDHRFSPNTLRQIEQGRALIANTSEKRETPKETAFLEAAVAHYVAFLAGNPQQQESESQEIERLRTQVADLEYDLRQAQALLHQAASTKRIQAKKKPQRAEPTISVDSLKPDGTMRSYLLRWEQNGLLAIIQLESIDERSSARGYRLDYSCHSIARPSQQLGERQRERASPMIKAARIRMVEELLKAGWKPSDPANADASVTVWKYQGGNEKR